LLLFAASAAFGFLSKYSIVFLLSGLFISLLIVEPAIFRRKFFWISAALFIIIISPNVSWQFRNHFPVFDHFSSLKKLIANETLTGNLAQFILTLNPFAAPVWFSGIFLAFFHDDFKKYRLVSFSMLFALILLIAARGRFYYFFPVALAGFCFGSVYIENFLFRRKRILAISIITAALTGLALLPFSLPVMPLEKYVKLINLREKEDGRIPLRFESRYTKDDWFRLTEAVNNAFNRLSAEEMKNCLILGSDYTQPAVINLFGGKYGLPMAFSFHGSYYTWIPDFKKGITVVAIGNTHYMNEQEKWVNAYKELFDEVEVCTSVFCKYARDDRNACFQILICRGIKCDSKQFRQKFRERIFE
jgi:hypothetical protein